ncbi:MAG: helix-turn-helix domain-containing protein [Pseudomonadota bacterium]
MDGESTSDKEAPLWDCPAARALDQIGDWWTMQIVRESIYGARRFGEYHSALGISKNILSQRLKKMAADGLIEKREDPQDARASIYRLTEKGRSLMSILVALVRWGDEWSPREGGPSIEFMSRATGRKVADMAFLDDAGTTVPVCDVRATAGPGASPSLRARFNARRKSRRA